MQLKISEIQNIKFIFVGGNIEIENINVIPWIPREEIGGYYSICDVLVLPRPNHPQQKLLHLQNFLNILLWANQF